MLVLYWGVSPSRMEAQVCLQGRTCLDWSRGTEQPAGPAQISPSLARLHHARAGCEAQIVLTASWHRRACQSSRFGGLSSLQACRSEVQMLRCAHACPCIHLCHRSSQHGQWGPQIRHHSCGACSLQLVAWHRFDDGQHKPDVDEDIEGADDEAVTTEVMDELERFLYFANVIYEAGNDTTLTRLLGDKGTVPPLKTMLPSAMPGLLLE